MTRMYPTAYLEYHADQYAAALLHKQGVSLDQYLADPARYQDLLTRPFPLLPTQTRVRTRLMREEIKKERLQSTADLVRDELRREIEAQLEQELDGYPRNNVRPFEPMRHHRYPKRRGFACWFKRSPKPTPHPTRG
ncbi:hypothetical protein [Marinobacter subterrani]|uniref:Uncharacterized protein n=1 Tax=Marinobacter subterrani TaxID=1658765 RepID=A0A0J7LYQ9_9GAMM|nr:hypothetical protein [Marinobacter subterrani]KMQ74030.1 hypothetical protein Msub_10201 [Marinobacter subterrani]